jgi:hypothetical protein
MTREQAKEILSLYRPNGGDSDDPFFVEALERADSDPDLKKWFAEQQAFDTRMAGAIGSIIPPEDLKKQLLRSVRQPREWWNRPLRRLELAAAACIALTIGLVALWTHDRGSGMSVRDRAIEASWGGERHVNLETSNLAEIRRFIAAHDSRGDFKLPPELTAMRPRGCSLLNVDGKKVPFVCFVDETKHLHLVVLDKNVCAVSPSETPEFDRWNSMQLTTWTQGDLTFVLTGMRPVDFVKKFRRERQWTWGG